MNSELNCEQVIEFQARVTGAPEPNSNGAESTATSSQRARDNPMFRRTHVVIGQLRAGDIFVCKLVVIRRITKYLKHKCTTYNSDGSIVGI